MSHSNDIDRKSVDQVALKDIKSRHPNVDEYTLIRYLLINKNIGDASRQLARTLAWRKSYLPITTTTIMSELKTKKLYLHGVDSKGYPLLIFDVSKHDVSIRNKDECIKCLIFLIESIYLKLAIEHEKRNIADTRGRILKFSIFINRSDMKGVADMELLKSFADIISNHYPLCLYKVYIYPSSFIFKAAWQVAKTFLPSQASDAFRPKMSLISLRNSIPDKYLPVNIGGCSTYQFSMDHYASPFLSCNYDYIYNNVNTIEFGNNGVIMNNSNGNSGANGSSGSRNTSPNNSSNNHNNSSNNDNTNISPRNNSSNNNNNSYNSHNSHNKREPTGQHNYNSPNTNSNTNSNSNTFQSPSSIVSSDSNKGGSWSSAQRK